MEKKKIFIKNVTDVTKNIADGAYSARTDSKLAKSLGSSYANKHGRLLVLC